MSVPSAGNVVVIGSTNVDLIMQVAELPKPGETVGDARFSQARGGKGANQALAAVRSGAAVTFVSVVGQDTYGDQAREAYKAEGMNVSLMGTSAEPTGTALIFVDRHGENCIGVAPGANAACDEQHIEHAISAIRSAAVVLLQLEIPLAAVRACLRRDTSARIILNAAPMLDLLPADLQSVDTLIVNETELGQIVARCVTAGQNGPAGEPGVSCHALHQLGVAHVVVTLGRDGVFLSASGEQTSLPGFSVNAVDTTGAGDTFCGALAARLARGESFEQAVTYAQAAAALACTQLGAQGAIPIEPDVLSFLASPA